MRDRAVRLGRFTVVLTAAQAERHLRRDVVDVPGSTELAWVLHERQVMLDLVNTERAAEGKEPVEMAAVVRVEHSAMGGIDYTHKYALRCVFLVEGE